MEDHLIRISAFDLNYFTVGSVFSISNLESFLNPFDIDPNNKDVIGVITDANDKQLLFDIYYHTHEGLHRIDDVKMSVSQYDELRLEMTMTKLTNATQEISKTSDMRGRKIVKNDDIGDHTVGRFIDYKNGISYLLSDNRTGIPTGFNYLKAFRDIKITEFDGIKMVKIPKFYYKIEPIEVDGNALISANYFISDKPKASFKLHPAFSACFGAPHVGVNDASLYVAVEAIPLPNDTNNMSEYIAKVRSKPGWDLCDIFTFSALQLLRLVEEGLFNKPYQVSYRHMKFGLNQYISRLNIDDTGKLWTGTYRTNIKIVDDIKNEFIEYFEYDSDMDWLFIPTYTNAFFPDCNFDLERVTMVKSETFCGWSTNCTIDRMFGLKINADNTFTNDTHVRLIYVREN